MSTSLTVEQIHDGLRRRYGDGDGWRPGLFSCRCGGCVESQSCEVEEVCVALGIPVPEPTAPEPPMRERIRVMVDMGAIPMLEDSAGHLFDFVSRLRPAGSA
jgi:hypothetical protein